MRLGCCSLEFGSEPDTPAFLSHDLSYYLSGISSRGALIGKKQRSPEEKPVKPIQQVGRIAGVLSLALLVNVSLTGSASSAVDKFDEYYRGATNSKSDLVTASRYAIGALSEAVKLNMTSGGNRQKYDKLLHASDDLYSKCKDKDNWDLALAIAKQELATDEALYGATSFRLLKYLFCIQNTLGSKAWHNGKDKQIYKQADSYCQRALTIGEKLPSDSMSSPNNREIFEAATNLALLVKDYKTTLAAQDRKADLDALQKRIERMPMFSSVHH
jgi:hypothetical protein